MGKEDIGLKSYLEDARRYADLWNGGVFRGRQMLKPARLRIINPVLSSADGETALEKSSDLVMMQDKSGQQFAIWAVENQKTVDYGMPLRIMMKEALEYNRQLKSIIRTNVRKDKLYREGKGNRIFVDAGEYLYKVRKQDKLHPIVTLVVYYGEEKWQGAASLHEMMDFDRADPEMALEIQKLVPEYPLHILDLSCFQHFEYFKTELEPFFSLYQKKNRKKEFVEYLRNREVSQKMDEESWDILCELINSRELKQLTQQMKKGKDREEEMSCAFDEFMYEEREEAKREGKKAGKAESIIDLLEEHGTVPDDLKKEIFAQKDLMVLKDWLKMAVKASGIEDFASRMNEPFVK